MSMALRSAGPGAANLQGVAGGQEDGEPEAIKGKFDHAINKVKNAPKKAQKKIPPQTVPNLERDKMESVRSTQNAKREEQQAQSMVDSDPMAAEAAKGGNSQDLISKLSANFSGAAGQGPAGMSAIASASGGKMGNLSSIRNMSGDNSMLSKMGKGGANSLGSPAGINDVGQLMGMFKSAQGQAGEMRGGLSGMSGQQNQLMEKGGMEQQRVDGLGALKDMFGSKEMAHGAKQKAFGEAGKGLNNAAKGLGTAAQVMSSVSQMLKGVAAAVAAIPFVGPALSAAMKKAATVVDVVGKVLKMAGNACKKSGTEMNQKSAQEGGLKDMNQVKKVDTGAQQKMMMDKVNRTQEQLDQTSEAKRDTQGQLEQNAQQQQEIAGRLNELGMPVAAPVGGAGEGQTERPQIANGIKNGKNNRRPAAPSPAPAGAAPGVAAPVSPAKSGGAASPAAQGGPGAVEGPKAPAQGAPAQGAPAQGSAPAAAQPAKAGQPGKAGKEDENAQVQGVQPNGQPNRVNPMARNNKQQKPGENRSMIAGPSAGGSSAAGGNSKRDRFESELSRLAADVNDSKKAAGKQANSLRDKQRQLSLVYNQAATENVSVKEDIERAASQALSDSPERPTRKLRTVQGNEALASAEGGGEDGQNGERRPGALRNQRGIGGRPGVGGLNIGGGMNPMGSSQMIAGPQPVQQPAAVQPVQQVAV